MKRDEHFGMNLDGKYNELFWESRKGAEEMEKNDSGGISVKRNKRLYNKQSRILSTK